MTQRLEVTTPEALPEETGADAALRPSRLDEFVGQTQVKASLQIAIDAARHRGDTLDHTLFFGPPGLGKTTLAMLMAREMGVQLRTSSGPVLEKPGDLVGLLTSLGPGDMLFIDEIHRLRPALEDPAAERSGDDATEQHQCRDGCESPLASALPRPPSRRAVPRSGRS